MNSQQVPLPKSSSVFTNAARKREEVLAELAVLLLGLRYHEPLQQWTSENGADCTNWRERALNITRQLYDKSSHKILSL